MMTKLKQLIAPPVFEDAQATRTAHLLNIISISYFFVLGSITFLGLFQSGTFGTNWVAYLPLVIRVLPIFVAVVAAQILMRRGNIKLASYLYVVLLWLSYALGIWFYGGIQSAALTSFILASLIAGLLIGNRGATITAGLSTLYVITIFILQNQGIIQTQEIAQVERLLSIILNLILSAVYLSLYIRDLDNALEKEEESNKLLTQIRDNLEIRVSERTKDLALAAEIGQDVSQIRDLGELTATAVNQIRQRFDLYHAQLYLVDKKQNMLTLFASTGEAGEQMLAAGHALPIDSTSLNGRVAVEKQVVFVSDTATNPNFKPHPLLAKTRSEMVVPLLVGDSVVGVLDLQDNKPNTFVEEGLPAYITLAGQLAVAIENSNLFTEISRQADRLSILNEMSTAITSAANIDEVYKIAGKFTQQIVGGQRASLGLLDPDGETFEVLGLSGEKGVIPMGTHLPVSKTAVGLCIQQNRLIINADGHPENYADTSKLAEQGLISSMSAPISASGKTIGSINIGSSQANAFSSQESTLMQQISSLLSSAIENATLFADLTEEQERTRAILESIGTPVVIARVSDGTLIYVNEPTAQTLGVPHEELIGQATPNFFQNPEDRNIYVNNLRQDGQMNNFEVRLQKADDSPFWALLTGKIAQFQGEFVTITSFVDITERKKAEALIAKQALELQTVADLSTAVSTTLDTKQLLLDIANLTKESFNLYHAHIYLLDESDNTLKLTAGAGDVGEEMVAEGYTIPLDNEKSLVAQTARTKQGIIVNDVTADPAFLPNKLLPDTKSEMAVPMMVGNRVVGVIDVQADQIDNFTETDINTQTTLATQIAVALENARAFEQISHQEKILRQRDLQLAQANETSRDGLLGI